MASRMAHGGPDGTVSGPSGGTIDALRDLDLARLGGRRLAQQVAADMLNYKARRAARLAAVEAIADADAEIGIDYRWSPRRP